ncbi:uncharacterized protein LOC124428119 isoform X1 [Vespa crabro]|uniref:uncharacterized protein LOC124428119 isoform X1 n=1 Tax=Vespa crabro TaxID=7445 RepID=UPI001F002E37|nr:uncharacterized protein LOC124428119 isoform X1 [Vespa crabro]
MKNMAALIRHASYRIPFKSTSALFAVTTTTNARRDVARFASKLSSANDALKQNPKLEATRKSLSAKGFLRSIKSYDPPSDVNERIDKICAGQQISTRDEAKLEGGLSRFKIFAACAEEFKHSVPNSLLCIIETVGDLKEFYHTPVDTATPLETLRRMQLPKNLHVQYEYHRFHPGKLNISSIYQYTMIQYLLYYHVYIVYLIFEKNIQTRCLVARRLFRSARLSSLV